MGTSSWAIPVGTLSGLCVAMFLFIWWWFPRAYKRGVKMDMDRIDEERRERQAWEAQQRELEAQANANAAAEQNGGTGEDGAPPEYSKDGAPAVPAPVVPKPFKYTPQAYTAY